MTHRFESEVSLHFCLLWLRCGMVRRMARLLAAKDDGKKVSLTELSQDEKKKKINLIFNILML